MTGKEVLVMLTNAYNAYTKGRKVKHPLIFKVSELVHKQLKDELIPNVRFVDDGKEHQKALGLPVAEETPIVSLAFKSARVITDASIPKDSYYIEVRENEDGKTSN